MKKEILTREKIIHDLNYIYSTKNIIIFALITLLLGGACAWVISLCFPLVSVGDIIYAIVCLMYALIIICFCIVLVSSCRIKILISNNKFRITTDYLIERIPAKGAYKYRSPATLRFARYGEYAIQDNNYTWSEMFNLDELGVFRYSTVGDEFYIVTIDDKKILLAYNKRLFELEE